MDFFFVYLLCFVAVPFVIFILVLLVACLGDYVRNQWSRIPPRNLMPNMHLPSFRSLWSSLNNSRDDSIPISTQWRSPVISSVHRMPREARQSNSLADTPLVTNQSEREVSSFSEPRRSNAGTTIPDHATQQPPLVAPMFCLCGAHHSNILHSVPVRTPQQHTMTRMLYEPSSSSAIAGESHVPVTNLQSQVMAHVVHGPHGSQPTMTPLQHGSQTNAGAHAPHRTLQSYLQVDTYQSQRMVPEPREEPNRPNSDINAYITASVYQTYQDDKNTECAVCLGALKTGDMVMQMPLCSHVYHEKCICRWLLQKPSCPLCRSPVRAQLSVRVGD